MAIVVVLVGLCVGSFLNVCIDRLPAGRSLLHPPSHCDACGTALSAGELIPVLSYLLLRGKCRHCGAHIPLRTPLVEAMTGLAFFAPWWRWGISPWSALATLTVCLLTIVVAIKLDHNSPAFEIRRALDDDKRVE